MAHSAFFPSIILGPALRELERPPRSLLKRRSRNDLGGSRGLCPALSRRGGGATMRGFASRRGERTGGNGAGSAAAAASGASLLRGLGDSSTDGDLSVVDAEMKPALRIRANPRLVPNRRPFPPVVAQRDQDPAVAGLTGREGDTIRSCHLQPPPMAQPRLRSGRNRAIQARRSTLTSRWAARIGSGSRYRVVVSSTTRRAPA